MVYILCRNRVADFASWKTVFAAHKKAHLAAGLRLVRLWRTLEDRDNVFFLFEVASIDQAKSFITNPEASKPAEVSGVLDGEYHFVEDAAGY